MKTIKILLLNYEFPPMGGGAANATFNIAKELTALGHKVDVLTSKFKEQPEEETIHGFRVFRVASLRKGIHHCGMKGAYTYVLNAISKLRELLNSNTYDVAHCFFSLPTGLLTLLPGRMQKIPYIVSLRGSDVPGYDPFNKSLQLFHAFFKPITKIIWRRAKRVVALSDGLRETALLSAPEQTIDVIGNGVEADLFKPSKKEGEGEGIFRLITVSRLIERKGVQHILQALYELNDSGIQLQIVGTGHYEKTLKCMVNDLQLNYQVNFYGYCPREKLPELYNQSDCFILPSLAESFGIVFAEAMACGLPIIAGRTGGVPDLVKDENGILVKPGNVDDIKKAILRLKNNRLIIHEMRNACRERMVKLYSWTSVAKKYEAIYFQNIKRDS